MITIIIRHTIYFTHEMKRQQDRLDFLCLLQLLNTFPILLRIPGLTDLVFPGQKSFMTMVDELITENKRTWDADKPPRDLTDAFLAEMEKVRGCGMWCPACCD